MKHVVVLCGGRSAEHDISFLSAASVLKNLDPSKYQISVLGIGKDGLSYNPSITKTRLKLKNLSHISFPRNRHWLLALPSFVPPVDVVFPVLHGPYGEDGTVQGALEVLDIPYVGCGVLGSAVGMNKIQGKRILAQSGLPVLPSVSVKRSEWQQRKKRCVQKIEKSLPYPVFVKPASLGSSVGINKSLNREELRQHIEIAAYYDHQILIEQGIEAKEIELSVLGNDQPEVSVAGEIIFSREFYDYEAKYSDGGSKLLIPASLTSAQMSELQELSLAVFSALQLEGMARIDFLVENGTGKIWVNEPNTIPGFTDISMYPKLWEASGVPYHLLLDRLIELGLERHLRHTSSSIEF